MGIIYTYKVLLNKFVGIININIKHKYKIASTVQTSMSPIKSV